MKSANFSELYSVMKPATSSDSASGRSNGARLVSPTVAMKKMMKLGSSRIAYQPGAGRSGRRGQLGAVALSGDDPAGLIVPAVMKTATMLSPMATS